MPLGGGRRARAGSGENYSHWHSLVVFSRRAGQAGRIRCVSDGGLLKPPDVTRAAALVARPAKANLCTSERALGCMSG